MTQRDNPPRRLIFTLMVLIGLCLSPPSVFSQSTDQPTQEKRWLIQVFAPQSKGDLESIWRDLRQRLDQVHLKADLRDELFQMIDDPTRAHLCDLNCVWDLSKSLDYFGVIYLSKVHRLLGKQWTVEVFSRDHSWLGQQRWTPGDPFTLSFDEHLVRRETQPIVDEVPSRLWVDVKDQLKSVKINGRSMNAHSVKGRSSLFEFKLPHGEHIFEAQTTAGAIYHTFKLSKDSPFASIVGALGSPPPRRPSCEKRLCDGQVLLRSDLTEAPIFVDRKRVGVIDQSKQALITLGDGRYVLRVISQNTAYLFVTDIKEGAISRISLNQTTAVYPLKLSGVPEGAEVLVDHSKW